MNNVEHLLTVMEHIKMMINYENCALLDGHAACITALHYSYYDRSKFEIDIYQETPIERVGQGTVIGPHI